MYILITLVLVVSVYLVIVILPILRLGRLRLFLQLLEHEHGIARVSNIIIRLSQAQVRCFGRRLHSLAELLRQGISLSQALRRVPGFVPAQIAGMVQAGEECGDLARILPACRQLVNDGYVTASTARNYLIFALCLPLLLMVSSYYVFMLPLLQQIAAELQIKSLFITNPTIQAIFWSSASMLLITIVLYTIGLKLVPQPFRDYLVMMLPWRRKRLQRDFSIILANLLDAELPEEQAILLAAGATANQVIQKRAARVVQALQDGVALPQAIQYFTADRELQWRLSNACSGTGFVQALQGWQTSLDAQAFARQHLFSQLIKLLCVLGEGLLVGLLAIGLFSFLISIIEEALLW